MLLTVSRSGGVLAGITDFVLTSTEEGLPVRDVARQVVLVILDRLEQVRRARPAAMLLPFVCSLHPLHTPAWVSQLAVHSCRASLWVTCA